MTFKVNIDKASPQNYIPPGDLTGVFEKDQK